MSLYLILIQTMFGGLLTILEKLCVKNIIINKQGKDSKKYQEFMQIVKDKQIKVMVVKKRRWTKYWKKCKDWSFMAERRADTRKHIK